MMNPNMLARYDQWRQARIPRYAGGTNQVTAAGLARGGAMPLPYQNPDGMVRWDPATGRYITVPPAGTNTTPPPPWMGAMPRSINSQYWDDWTSAPPPGYSQDMWDQRFIEVDPNATPSHQLPVYEQSLSGQDPATWERIFQMYDQSQLAAAQAKWDADMAQYGGVYPGGGIMGPRPTGSTPASMQGQTPFRISDQQMLNYYTQLAALKGADGTVDPAAAAAVVNAIQANPGFAKLPGSIRVALSRFAGSQAFKPVGSPFSQYNAADLQSLLDALGERGFNAPPPPPREPYRGPRDQTKEIMARRVADGSGDPIPPPPPPEGDLLPWERDWQPPPPADPVPMIGGSGANTGWYRGKYYINGQPTLRPYNGEADTIDLHFPDNPRQSSGGPFGDWRDDPRNGWGGGPVGPGDPNHGMIPPRPGEVAPSGSDGSSVLPWWDKPQGNRMPVFVGSGESFGVSPVMSGMPSSLPGTISRSGFGVWGNRQGTRNNPAAIGYDPRPVGPPPPSGPTATQSPATVPPPPAATPTSQNPQAIVYGGNVWDKALQAAMSGKTAGANTGTNLFSLQGSPDQKVPTLPAFQRMNYTKWNQIRNATPDAFNFLKGAYSAGNRDLDSEYQQMKYNAPIGDARYTSGIRTTR